MILSKSYERLYLQKDPAQNIYIDLQKPLPQHQLDGIRFLFRQYKKKTPGVILNDPSGFGKCLQVVLFLDALRPILKSPILILSNSPSRWKEHFEKFTKCNDELAIETSNPFIKKLIFINPVKDGASFSRRSWSIVVMHDEEQPSPFTTKMLNFNADYKIWITSQDLKENLRVLASIYEWLYPNQKFNVEDFSADSANRRDVVEKELLLDAFLEDFLIRRTGLAPFEKPEKYKPKPSIPSPVKATRKNKDPTGTKVKRSKRRRIEDDDDNVSNVTETTVANETSNKDMSIKASNETANNMDVENFLRDENPIGSEEFNFVQNKNTSKDSIAFNVSTSMDTSFKNAVQNILEPEKPLNGSDKTDVESPIICHETDYTAKEGVTEATSDIIDVESPSICRDKDENTKKITDIEDDKNKNEIIVPATEDSSDDTVNNLNNNHNKQKDKPNESTIEDDDDDDVIITGIIVPETHSEYYGNSNSCFKLDNASLDGDKSVQANDWKIEDEGTKEEKDIEIVSIDVDKNKSDISKDNTNSSKAKVVGKRNEIDEFDAELAELEAKALAKFKGSILDSIF